MSSERRNLERSPPERTTQQPLLLEPTEMASSLRETMRAEDFHTDPAATRLDGRELTIQLAVDDLLDERQSGEVATGRWRELIAFYEAELRAAPEASQAYQAQLHYEIGRVYEERLGDLRQALAQYQNAYKADARHIANIRAARRLYQSKGNWNMVLQLLDAEVEASSDNGTRSDLCVEKGRIAEDRLANVLLARTSYLRALDLDKTHPGALKSLENLYLRESDWEALYDVYQHIAGVTVDRAQRSLLFCNMAELREVRSQDSPGAVELYAVALEEDPQNLVAIAALRRLHHAGRRWSELCHILNAEGELSESPDERALLAYLAGRSYQSRLGDAEKAMECYLKALGIDPLHVLSLGELARLYEGVGRWPELARALARLSEAVGDAKELAALHFKLGALYEERLGDEERAVLSYRKVLELEPRHRQALAALSRLYHRRGAWRELMVLGVSEAEAAEDPAQRAGRYHRLGELAEINLDDDGLAATHYRRALASQAGHLPSRQALERLFSRTGHWQDLAELYEAQLDQVPTPAEGIDLLTRIAQLWDEKLGQQDRAILTCKRILEIEPRHLGTFRILGRLYEVTGQHHELVKLLDLEASCSEDTVRIVTLLMRSGEVHEEKLHDAERAVERYRKVLELHPGDAPALSALGRVLAARGRWDDLIVIHRQEIDVSTQRDAQAALLERIARILDENLGREDDAVAAYEEAVACLPTYVPALRALARLHRERRRWEALIDVLRRESELVDDALQKADSLFQTGEIWEEYLQREDPAVDLYRQALALVPGHGPSLAGLERILSARKSWRDLIEVYQRVMAACPDGPEGDAGRVKALLQMGALHGEHLLDPVGAAECYERALQLDAANLAALRQLERLYLRIAAWEELIGVYDRLAAISADPGQRVALWCEVAQLMELRAVPPRDPTEVYLRVIDIAPRCGPALEALERIYSVRRDHDGLARILGLQYQLALERNEEPISMVPLLGRLGDAHEARGEYDEAAECYARALAAQPEYLPAVRAQRRLHEARRDWEAIIESLEREGRMVRDPATAAAQLLRAAVLRLERFNDEEQAIATLEEVIGLDPNHPEGTTRLEELLTRRKEWSRLVDVLQRRISSAAEPSTQVELLYRQAIIQRDQLHEPQSAVAAFGRVTKLEPNHLPALTALGDLHFDQELWNEAVSAYGRVVALSDDNELLRRVQYRLGVIWDEKLSDGRKAISSFQNVLALDPDGRDIPALERLFDIFSRERDWENAVDSARRLIRAETDRARLVRHWLALASIHETGFGEPLAAAEAYRSALALEPTKSAALDRLADLYARLGDWQSLVDALGTYVANLPPDLRQRAINVRMRIGEVQADKLGRLDRAIQEYREAITLDPSHVDARVALANIYRQRPEHTDDAIREHRALLALNPLRLESYRELRRLYERKRDKDAAYCCAQILHYFKSADEVEEYQYRELRQKGVREIETPLTEEMIERLVIHPHERHAGRELFSLLDEHLHRLYPSRLDEWGVGRGDRYGARSELALRRLCDRVMAQLGSQIEFDLYVARQRPREIDLEPGDPPALLVGFQVETGMSTSEQRFQVGRLLGRLRSHTHAARKLTALDLEIILAAAVRLFDLNFGDDVAPADVLSDRGKRLAKALPRRSRKALEDACARYRTTRTPNFELWLRGMEHSANRTGLLVCNDIATAVEIIRRSDRRLAALPVGTTEEMLACLRDVDPVAELLRYSVSDEHFAVRRATGLALV